MKENDLKNIINTSLEKLPFSFNNIVFKRNEIINYSKILKNNKLKDNGYSITVFYKPISKF